MKYLNKFRSEDEYWKNYEGYTNLVSSIVVNNVTYNYSHMSYKYFTPYKRILRSASSSRRLSYTIFFWEDPNHPNDETYMVATTNRNPEVGLSARSYDGDMYDITNVTTSPASGRDIPYIEPWCSLINQKVNYRKSHIEELAK